MTSSDSIPVNERELDAQPAIALGCYDCGLRYGDDGWIECMVPNDVWLKIGHTGDLSGILCITCIARRAKRLGLTRISVMLCGTEALRVASQDEAFDRGWSCARDRIEELEARLRRCAAVRPFASGDRVRLSPRGERAFRRTPGEASSRGVVIGVHRNGMITVRRDGLAPLGTRCSENLWQLDPSSAERAAVTSQRNNA